MIVCNTKMNEMKIKKIFLFASTCLLLFSCVKKQEPASLRYEMVARSTRYATGFTIDNKGDYKLVEVENPWKRGEVFARYFLVKNNDVVVPENGVKVKIPLQSIATSSVTHLEFLNLLDEIERIDAVCNPELVYNEKLRAQIDNNITANIGDAFAINVEKTMKLKPGALMMSGYNTSDANAQRIEQGGIPVIYNNEWMEHNLLARAEWIKFVAVFFEKDNEADSIFNVIEYRYNEMKKKASGTIHKPTIMAGSTFRGTWYMPAGRSFMSELFKDAGASYFYANDTTSGSLPLNVEMALKNFSQSEVWLNCNYSTITDLLREDSKHALFRPVKENNVYNFRKRMLASSANDFWESAVARPDLLLADVIAILHPELLPDYELFYAEKLEN